MKTQKASSNEVIAKTDNSYSMFFVAYITNGNNESFCFSTNETKVSYKNLEAINALDFNNVLNSIATSRSGAMELTIAGNLEETDFYNATIEILLSTSSNANELSLIFSGFVSKKTYQTNATAISVIPITNKLKYNIGEFYSEFCRAELGDERCKADLGSMKINGNIEHVVNNRIFTISENDKPADFFSNGTIKFNSGKNAGSVCRVMLQDHSSIYLLTIPRFEISPGDAFTLTTGCDKNFKTCRDKFKNIINFRGEPFINGAVLKELTPPVEQYQETSQKSGK